MMFSSHMSFFFKNIYADINDSWTIDCLSAYAGVGVYRKFYTEEKESFYGVLAISVSKPTAQPYIIMTELLAVRATFLGSMRIIIFLPEHFLYKYSNKYYTKLVGFSKTFHALFIMCLQFLLWILDHSRHWYIYPRNEESHLPICISNSVALLNR